MSFEVRGRPGLPDETQLQLARIANPIWFEPQDSEMTVAEVLELFCGRQSPAVHRFLQDATKRINAIPSLSSLTEPGLEIAVPFCLKVERNVLVPVEPGDTVEGLLRQAAGIFGPKTSRLVYELNKDSYDANDEYEFFTHLRPNSELLLPYAAPTRTLSLPAEVDAAPLLSELMPAQPVPTAAAVESTIKYVRFVDPASLNSEIGCRATEAFPAFDASAVEARLRTERQRRDASAPSVVGIIDNGMISPSRLRESLFRRTSHEIPNNEVDDGDNGFIDDVYGINLNGGTDEGFIGHYGESDGSHGTKIGALALGGPAFLEVHRAFGDKLLQLKIVNFSRADGSGPRDVGEFGRAIDYLKQEGADVINMSVSTRRKASGMLLPMRELYGSSLFVVAAGNAETGAGIDLGARATFPARFGGRVGEASRNVVTVAAHDTLGQRARYSHYSSEFADLLAPGCMIETFDENLEIVSEFGTSVATAIVSFTAALISGLGVDRPAKIKNRLLASTDVDDALAASAWTSGRLNVVKAISVTSDVVHRRDDSLEFGDLADTHGLSKYCAEDGIRPLLQNTRRIRPNIPSAAGHEIEYWVETDGRLSKLRCQQRLTNESIGSFDRDGAVEPGPALSDVKDIVLSTLEPAIAER